MVYYIDIEIDGGCRNIGYSDAYAAAAACHRPRWARKYTYNSSKLWANSYNPRTSQRAEITALILGLELAYQKWEELEEDKPAIDVSIKADSRYVIDAMNDYLYKWSRNNWLNSRGLPVANSDLWKQVVPLHNKMRPELGTLTYEWIPREDNTLADGWCNKLLAEMEEELF